jgi:hypothetical protein
VEEKVTFKNGSFHQPFQSTYLNIETFVVVCEIWLLVTAIVDLVARSIYVTYATLDLKSCSVKKKNCSEKKICKIVALKIFFFFFLG